MKGKGPTRQELLDEVGRLRTRLKEAEAKTIVPSPPPGVAGKQAEEPLWQYGERLKMALKAAGAGLWDWNMQTGAAVWSEEVYPLYGVTPDSFKPSYSNWLQTIHPDDREQVQQGLLRACGDGDEASLKFRIVHPDGTIRWIESRGRVLCDDAGQPFRAVGICLDITAPHQTKEDLRESEAKIRTILDNANDGILLADAETYQFTFANKTICQMLGYGLEEIRNLGINDIHPRERLAYIHEQFNIALNKGIPFLIPEIPVLRKDGSVFYAEINSTPMRLAGKRFGLGIFRDITERRQAEEAFKAIFEGAPIGMVTVDLEGRFLKANVALHELLGYSDQELVGKFISEITFSDDLPASLALYQQAWAGGLDRYRLKKRYQRQDGSLIWGDISVSLIRGSGGEPLFVVGMIQDITARKQAEEEIRRYHRQLQGLAAQLGKMQEAERQLLARELHDRIGQNLSVLGINLNLVQGLVHEGDKDQIQARLADAVALVEQIVPLTRNLMTELRPPELEDYGLLDALRWHGAKFCQRTNIAMDVVGEEPAPRLDPSVEISLFRIAQEALINVAKHAQATRVTVVQEVAAGNVRLTIADNGLGFVATSQKDANGCQGWGMISMTERAVAAGGHCRIESKPGKGTRVIVEVPR